MQAIPVVAFPLLASAQPWRIRPKASQWANPCSLAIATQSLLWAWTVATSRAKAAAMPAYQKAWERVWASQLPAQCECAIGGSGGLIGIAAMPQRPGQQGKGADPD